MPENYSIPHPVFAWFPVEMDNGEKIHFRWYWRKQISTKPLVWRKGLSKDDVEDHPYKRK
jgi:hypothetical protein